MLLELGILLPELDILMLELGILMLELGILMLELGILHIHLYLQPFHVLLVLRGMMLLNLNSTSLIVNYSLINQDGTLTRIHFIHGKK